MLKQPEEDLLSEIGFVNGLTQFSTTGFSSNSMIFYKM